MRWRGLLCCADCILRLAFVSIIAMFLFGTPLLNWSKEMWFFLYWHLKTNWYERFETCCDSINSRKYCLTMKTSNNKLWLHQLALGLEIWKSSQMVPSILWCLYCWLSLYADCLLCMYCNKWENGNFRFTWTFHF